MRILIVEDEKSLADIIKRGLEEEDYAVDVAYNGENGLFMAENEPSDLILLDIMLPIVDGMTILKKIRKAGVRTPVLMLTAKDTLTDKVSGLDSGADDYLTKPFLFEELLARVRALLGRSCEAKTSVIEIGDLTIDMEIVKFLVEIFFGPPVRPSSHIPTPLLVPVQSWPSRPQYPCTL